MLLARFDRQRLHAIAAAAVQERHCARTQALIAACRLGTGPASRPWAAPWARSRIEMPWACYQVDDAEIARRACLVLDGSWRMADASPAGRWLLRAQAMACGAAWWRALQEGDAWDCGEAPVPAALAGFEPRRTTLMLIHGVPDEICRAALADLERRSLHWRRALRVVLVGAPPGFARHLGI